MQPVEESPFATRVRRELRDAREGPERVEDHNGKVYIYRRGGQEPIQSAHQAYAVILEELDEFWDEVKKKRGERNLGAMFRELVQIGAMAQRAAEDLGLIES